MTFGRPNKALKNGPGGLAGFTLLEIMIALALIAVLFASATPLLTASGREGKLRKAAEDVEVMVRSQRAQALSSGNRVTMQVRAGGFYQEGKTRTQILAMPKGVDITLRAPGEAWGKPEGQEWEFSPMGFVTPYSVRLQDGDTWMEIDFDLLTGRPAEERYAF